MRRILFFVALFVSFIMICNTASAYMVNPFFAISSGGEYNNVKDMLNGNSNQMYFQWGRIIRDDQEHMVFTSDYNKLTSRYDHDTYYGFPGDNNLKDYKSRYPQGKAFLSVFFNGNTIECIDFLNMSKEEWESNIMDPIMDMVNTYNFDGVVLDFEEFRKSYNEAAYPVDQKTDMDKKYNNFLECMDESIGEKQLVVCIHPTNVAGYYDGYDYEFINQIADYIILMAYGYEYGPKYSEPGILNKKYKSNDVPGTQPYDKVNDSVNKIINQQGIQHEKLIVGLDLAPVKWLKFRVYIDGSLKTYFEKPDSRPSLNEVLNIKVQEEFSDTTKVCKKVISREQALEFFPTTYGQYGDELQSVEYYYESQTSIYDKYHTILSMYGLAGVSVWRLGTGAVSVWESLMDLNDEPTSTPVPMPTPTLAPVPQINLSGASNWAITEITKAFKYQIVTEKVLESYTQNITREEFCELATKLYEGVSGTKAQPISPNPFKDTSNPEILKANKLGIVNGKAPDKFAPSDPVTRQEICVMICRTLRAAIPGLNTNPTAYSNFADDSSIANWAINDVRFCNSAGIMNGVGNNKINPTGNTTREQAIALMVRTYEKYVE